MAEKQEPRNGVYYDWDNGSAGWGAHVSANFKFIGLSLGLSVKDRDLATPPTSPADGDAYLVAASPTGAWASHVNKVAIWVAADNAWTFLPLRTGLEVFVEDESIKVLWKGTAWGVSATVA